ncbi:MAG TPA: hypothetical protein VF598_12350, partial [Hymenobacter sp.]
MNAFDFHGHPFFKRLLTTFNDADRQNAQATVPIKLPRPIGGVVDALVGHILENQGSVGQALANKSPNDVRLGVAGVLALEYVFASRTGVLKLLELELFGKDVVAPLDSRYFQFVNQSEGSYFQLLEKELRFYDWVNQESAKVPSSLTHKIKLLTRKSSQPLAKQINSDRLNLVLAIEGGHSLSQRLIRLPVGPYDPVGLIKTYRQPAQPDFLYLTLTHLAHTPEQPLCSHAFG